MYMIVAYTEHEAETVEEDIETREEAEYLLEEYRLVYKGIGSVVIKRQRKKA